MLKGSTFNAFRTAILVAGLVSLPARAARGRPGPHILLLTGEGLGAGPSIASFELALAIQLRPYGIGTRTEHWTLPSSVAEQVRQARQRADRSGAAAAAWFAAETVGEQTLLRLQILDLRGPEPQLRRVDVGMIEPGVERSLAAVARTLLVAGPEGARAPDRGAAPPPPPRRERTQRPHEPGRFSLGVGYGVDIYPMGDELRHGPHLGLSVRVWRRLEALLLVGYRHLGSDGIGSASWSREAARLLASVRYSWPLSRRWSVSAGLSLRSSAIHVVATSAVTDRTDRTWLWEIAPGLAGGAAVKLWRELSMEVTVFLAWVALGHQVAVQGSEVARSGRVGLSVVPMVRYGF